MRAGSGLGPFLRPADRLRRKHQPAIVDQAFQPVRRHIQRDDIARFFLARRLFQALGLKHAVDFALDFVELCFLADLMRRPSA